MNRPLSGLYEKQPRQLVIRDLINRSRVRMEAMPDAKLDALLEEALWHERKRLERAKDAEEEKALLDDLARALVRGTRHEKERVGLRMVGGWAEEIHGRFNHRAYRFATKILPRALTGLLTGRPDRLRDWELDTSSHVRVEGDLPLLKQLAQESTLILAPTHVSNLDSPLIGLALHLAGLPPFVYGAGLNLFKNKVMGWWMHRLGAYTVDRLKRNSLYKEVLKDYSVRCLTTRHHSLFFPGGTRSRSNELETKLKKGLLGTGVVAWQEMLEQGRPDSEVYVVPLTLSFSLSLEAATLIEDHLEEAGKQRFIITDDEFTQPRRLAAFAKRVLDLDAAIVAHFGDPIDVMGMPVPRDPDERRAAAERRRGYVTNREGKVERDSQRDRIYTDRLASALVDAYPRYAWAMPTHVVAYTAWQCLEEDLGTTDPFRIVRSPIGKRHIHPVRFSEALERVLARVHAGVEQGRWQEALPSHANEVLSQALDRFSHYHRSHALIRRGTELVVEDPKLCLYYRNRLVHIDREA